MIRWALGLCCMGGILLALAAQAGKGLDPTKTTLPTYWLPATAAADGKLTEWAGIPAFGPENFKYLGKDETITPSDDFAPSIRCGMKQGSPDLYFLIVVKDQHFYVEDRRQWLSDDYLEFYLDFGRAGRDTAVPGWQTDKTYKVPYQPAGLGQWGLRPRTLQGSEKALLASDAQGWTSEYASALIEGGLAYEVHLDFASVQQQFASHRAKDIDAAKGTDKDKALPARLEALPAYIGINIGLMDQDYALELATAGWSNDSGSFRLFGNGMDHAFPTNYGMVSLQPQPAPATAAPRPKTLEELYGEFPTGKQLKQAIGKLPPAKLAELIYWAGCQGAVLDAPLVKSLMALGDQRVRESVLGVLYFADGDKAAVKTALDAVYQRITEQTSPYVLTLANLLNEQFTLGYRPQVKALLAHADLTVAFTAARALGMVGAAEDVPGAEQTYTTLLEAQQTKPRKIAYQVFMGTAVDALKSRSEKITLPAFTPLREIAAANTDLARFMPVDGNNVYNGKGLLRVWPKGGPQELWRVEIGKGKSAVVEAGGRAFTAATIDDRQYALALDAKTGALLWKTPIGAKDGRGMGPTSSPLVDGDRVYYVPSPNASGAMVVCLNAADGTERWRTPKEIQGAEFSTPVIVGDTLYLGLAQKDTPFAALDALTGALRWKAPPAAGGASCASPCVQVIDGMPQVIAGIGMGDASEVWGMDANTGALLWKYPDGTGYGLISSPVAVGSKVFLCDGYGPFATCLQMYVRDGKIKARQVYRNEKNQRNLYNTVAVWKDAVYGFSGNMLQCTDLNTGQMLWKHEQKEWTAEQQLIVADGLLFATNANGEIVLAEANRTGYQERGRVRPNLELGERQKPTIANGHLYVRGVNGIVCYDLLNAK